MQLVTVIVKLRISSRLREFAWVGASPPWRRGPQVRATLAAWGHGAVDVVGPVTPSGRVIGRGDSQECTQIGENGPSTPFWGIRVHCCDASCDASRVRWHERPNRHGVPAAPPRWPPPTWSENSFCASGGAASLVSSPRQQPTQTPGETYLPRIPNKKRLR